MRRIMLALAATSLLTPPIACAQTINGGFQSGGGKGGGGAAPIAGCVFSNNGCPGSTAFVANPFFADNAAIASTTIPGSSSACPNFVVDTAESGQLTAGYSTADAQARCNQFFTNSEDFAYGTYKIGSANPATLTAVSAFPSVSNSDYACSYGTNTGLANNGGPALTCTIHTSNTIILTISGYDFSNTGGGTGTGCAELDILTSGVGATNVTLNVINDYFQANLEGSQANHNFCFSTSTVAPTGHVGTFVYLSPSASNAVGTKNFINDWFDGNAFWAANNGIGPADYRITAIYDKAGAAASQKTFEYSGCVNLGHICMLGPDVSNLSVLHSIARNTCLSAQSNCHGEWAEATGLNSTRTIIYTDANLIIDSVPYAYYGTGNAVLFTTPYYVTSGAPNNTVISSAQTTDSFIVSNNTGCANNSTGGFGTSSPYGPALQSTPPPTPGVISAGFVAVNKNDSVNSITVERMVIDATATIECLQDLDEWGSVSSLTASSAGTTMTVALQAPNYVLNSSSTIWPGMGIWRNDGLGFTPTQLGAFGTFTNGPNFAGSISGTTLTTDVSQVFAVGDTITGPGVAANTTIVSGSGTSWQVSVSQTTAHSTGLFDNPVGGNGTLGLGVSEPTISAQTGWHLTAWIVSTTQNNTIYSFTNSASVPHAITIPTGGSDLNHNWTTAVAC